MRTTSGCVSRGQLDRLRAVRRAADDLDVLAVASSRSSPARTRRGPRRAGRGSCGHLDRDARVPRPGVESISSVAAGIRAARSSSSRRPKWPSPRGLRGVEPAAVVFDHELTRRCRSTRPARDIRASACLTTLRSASCATRKKSASSLAVSSTLGLDVEARLDARAPRSRRAGRRAPPRGRRGAAPAGRSRRGGVRSWPIPCRVSAAALRSSPCRTEPARLRPPRESEYDTPARSCTTPSCRSRAIRRRSTSEASIARLSSRSRSSWLRRTRPASCQASGSWASASRISAPSITGANWRKIRRARAETKLEW